MKQNRDGIPPSLAEKKRFIEKTGWSKEAMPTGWNNPDNWKTLDDIPEGKPFTFMASDEHSGYLGVDFDHVFDENGEFINVEIRTDLQRLMDVINTYREKSQSKKGLHFICYLGDLEGSFEKINDTFYWGDTGDDAPHMEIYYKTDRNFFLTGDCYQGCHEIAKDEDAAALFRAVLNLRDELVQRYPECNKKAATSKTEQSEDKKSFKMPDDVPDGVRAKTLVRAIGSLVSKGLSREAIEAAVRAENLSKCVPPLTDEELKKHVLGAIARFTNNISEKYYHPYDHEVPGLILLKDGSVKSCYANCYTLVKHLFSEKLKLNELSMLPEIQGVDWRQYSERMVDDDYNRIFLILNKYYNQHSFNNAYMAINTAAFDNPYHPIRELLNGLQWDGQEHCSNLFPRFLGAEKSDYVTEITKLLFLGAIARVFQPGVKFDIAVVLVDNKQGSGKSSMVRFMALRDEWFSDTLPEPGSPKMQEYLTGKWIIELGEMQALLRAKYVEDIKAMLSRQKEVYRVPYSKTPIDYYRQNIFIGTTNEISFLPRDQSGNRRFIPIRCHGDQAESHPLDNEEVTRKEIEQCYAEMMQLYKALKGDSHILKPSMLITGSLVSSAEGFEAIDEERDQIYGFLDDKKPETVCIEFLYREAIYQYLPHDEYLKINRSDRLKVAQIMDNHPDYIRAGKRRFKFVPSFSGGNEQDLGPQRVWIRKVRNKEQGWDQG